MRELQARRLRGRRRTRRLLPTTRHYVRACGVRGGAALRGARAGVGGPAGRWALGARLGFLEAGSELGLQLSDPREAVHPRDGRFAPPRRRSGGRPVREEARPGRRIAPGRDGGGAVERRFPMSSEGGCQLDGLQDVGASAAVLDDADPPGLPGADRLLPAAAEAAQRERGERGGKGRGDGQWRVPGERQPTLGPARGRSEGWARALGSIPGGRELGTGAFYSPLNLSRRNERTNAWPEGKTTARKRQRH